MMGVPTVQIWEKVPGFAKSRERCDTVKPSEVV